MTRKFFNYKKGWAGFFSKGGSSKQIGLLLIYFYLLPFLKFALQQQQQQQKIPSEFLKTQKICALTSKNVLEVVKRSEDASVRHWVGP